MRSIVGISFVKFDEIFFSKVKDDAEDDDEDDFEAVFLLLEFELVELVTVFWQEVVVV